MVIIVVDGKGRRQPIRLSGMAAFAIGGQGKCRMVGVGASFEIRRVAARTGVGGIGIVTVVAGVAVIGYGEVRAREGVDLTVVESSRRPLLFSMAVKAIG